jgi:twinkle protein
MHEGHDKLKALLGSAKEIRMEGIFTADDVRAQLMHMWTYGLPKGTTTHYPSIDKIWKWRLAEVNTVTGFAGDGKSTLLNVNLPTVKAVKEGWKFGLFIPENLPPEEFFEEVIHCYVGKTTDQDYPAFRMTEEEYLEGIEFVNKYFFLVFPEAKQTLDEIFERFDYLVRKHGINAIIIDPYNSIEHLMRRGETIDQYVTRFMSLLRRFAQKRNVAIILVCHQNPPDKKAPNGRDYPEPDKYRIKNGGSFADRTDNLLSVHRPTRFSDPKNPLVIVRSHKLKKKKLLMADTDYVELEYHWQSNRYLDPMLGGKSPLEVQKTITHEEVEALYEEGELPF